MSPFLMAVSTGQSNIGKFLVERKIDADHKSSSGTGCLQLALGVGGKHQEGYKWLLEHARDSKGEKLVLTDVVNDHTNTWKCRGKFQRMYRETNCIAGKGSPKAK